MTGPRRGFTYSSHGTDRRDVEHWTTRAACLDEDPELFWPATNTDPEDRLQAAAAKAVCRTCPVQNTCMEEAMEGNHTDGIWGGTTGSERKEIRERLARLDALLEDPAAWAHIASEALDAREAQPPGSPAWSAFTRLHTVATDLVRLATEAWEPVEGDTAA